MSVATKHLRDEIDDLKKKLACLRAENADLAKGVDPWRRICASQLDKLATARAALEEIEERCYNSRADISTCARKALEDTK